MRLRSEVWLAFENDWTVEIERTEPKITLSKGEDTLVFEIAKNYPFVAPRVEVNGEQCAMQNRAWGAQTPLCDYATRVLHHVTFLKEIRAMNNH